MNTENLRLPPSTGIWKGVSRVLAVRRFQVALATLRGFMAKLLKGLFFRDIDHGAEQAAEVILHGAAGGGRIAILECIKNFRVLGAAFAPPVFAPGRYRVRFGEPGTATWTERLVEASESGG